LERAASPNPSEGGDLKSSVADAIRFIKPPLGGGLPASRRQGYSLYTSSGLKGQYNSAQAFDVSSVERQSFRRNELKRRPGECEHNENCPLNYDNQGKKLLRTELESMPFRPKQ